MPIVIQYKVTFIKKMEKYIFMTVALYSWYCFSLNFKNI